ncbi:hypothetical protein B0T20DRAFT_393006 [Sordaria brevicollis]|uniref:Uncharacterized protein n=1 Tax=Sordaria brevicollis TaxID=83679 RepID=A0AAE0PF21_SORBR|nr:hypothetical protein B0T20DRAFT_393006 [Sordaria brevicollis]
MTKSLEVEWVGRQMETGRSQDDDDDDNDDEVGKVSKAKGGQGKTDQRKRGRVCRNGSGMGREVQEVRVHERGRPAPTLVPSALYPLPSVFHAVSPALTGPTPLWAGLVVLGAEWRAGCNRSVRNTAPSGSLWAALAVSPVAVGGSIAAGVSAFILRAPSFLVAVEMGIACDGGRDWGKSNLCHCQCEALWAHALFLCKCRGSQEQPKPPQRRARLEGRCSAQPSTGQSEDAAHGSRGIPLVAQAIPQRSKEIDHFCPGALLGCCASILGGGDMELPERVDCGRAAGGFLFSFP